MAKLTKEQLAYVATLARIEIQNKDLDLVSGDISSILGFVEQIQAIDTKDTQPISQVTGLKDVWREDIVQKCEISRDEMLANTPETQDGYVKVKKVL